MTNTSDQFDVAFSFAGEDDEFVTEVYKELYNLDPSLRIFYANEQGIGRSLLGEPLRMKFFVVFGADSRFKVLFISKYYVKKSWTHYEAEQALNHLAANRDKSVLPVQIDGSTLVSLPTDIGYAKAEDGAKEIAQQIFTKVKSQQQSLEEKENSKSKTTKNTIAKIFAMDKKECHLCAKNLFMGYRRLKDSIESCRSPGMFPSEYAKREPAPDERPEHKDIYNSNYAYVQRFKKVAEQTTRLYEHLLEGEALFGDECVDTFERILAVVRNLNISIGMYHQLALQGNGDQPYARVHQNKLYGLFVRKEDLEADEDERDHFYFDNGFQASYENACYAIEKFCRKHMNAL